MAKKQYEPTTRPMSVTDVQETIADAMGLINELKALVEKPHEPSTDPSYRPRSKAIDALMERRIERLIDKLKECNRAIPELQKQGADTESLSKRLWTLAESAIKLFPKLFGGGTSP